MEVFRRAREIWAHEYFKKKRGEKTGGERGRRFAPETAP
jgi:hypothetical protein